MTNSTAISPHLLPSGCSIREDGRVEMHGVALLDIAKEFGTPCFVYDLDHIKARANEARGAAPWTVAYASKAFLCRELVRVLDRMGLSMDVASGGELAVVISGGLDPGRIIFHGNNKSQLELSEAIDYGVGLVVVDSMTELERLESICRSRGVVARILIRITPGVEAHTHEFVMTGQEDTKFGFSLKSGEAEQAIERSIRSDFLDFVGIHAHIGSQIFLLDSYYKEVEALSGIIERYQPATVNLGGGLGVAYLGDELTPTFDEWARVLYGALSDLRVDSKTQIIVEPGRSLIASSALTLYRVGTIKVLPGLRTYVSVDGGMSDNPRPVLYDSGYEAFMPGYGSAIRDSCVTIVGKHCESGDVLIRNAWLPRTLAEGDIIATPVTGAYGYSMASNYNRVPRPPVVFVDSDGPRLAIRGETYEDLLRLEI
ncbi:MULTISPECIES: diaminopimelate decarboxylase [Acidithrix]|uniref:Diaminopimelate decarboxylase n=1 Tax=Acidithrix ferrooxidans TaxID=1280514 RepID=A0A0D8HJB7_9ACTN|nr:MULTISPECIES: diaminopimelate decarboxylase [Acidithrix]KJF18028.1 diaminopimelate decarboxylase [Acidithrix ferrooxidans]CAG4918528.1 unnamed protein product [Acidithrix sp. C25]